MYKSFQTSYQELSRYFLDSITPPGSARDITSPVSFREERALHYAMARFAEMEQSTPSTSPASTPREKTPTNTGSSKTSPNEGTKRQREDQSTVKIYCFRKL